MFNLVEGVDSAWTYFAAHGTSATKQGQRRRR